VTISGTGFGTGATVSFGGTNASATVYNTLHQFTAVGLLREVVVDMGQSYFDTNTSHHHHFFDEATGQLTDIAEREIGISHLPSPPPGAEIDRVEVIVRLRRPAA
jgi:Fur family iron response transcriptional regulator